MVSPRRPPDTIKKFVGLTARDCKTDGSVTLLSATEVDLLRNQVPGWRVVKNAAGKEAIRQDWKAKDADAAPKLAAKLTEVSSSQGHSANTTVTINGTDITVEMTTVAAGM